MARSSRTNTIGNIMQKVGRALSSNSSSSGRSRGGSFGGSSRSRGRSGTSKASSGGGAAKLLKRLFR